MHRPLIIAPLICAAVVAAGCLRQDTRHILYLSPDGSVVWSAFQNDVRSDAPNAAARAAEEQPFVQNVDLEMHPVAEALRDLEGEQISTRWIRRERPFGVLTAARFSAIDGLARRLFDRLGIPANVLLTRQSSRTTLTIEVRCSDVPSENAEEEQPVLALLEEPSRYRLVLTEGRFVNATGFTIPEDDVAVPEDRDACADPPGDAVVVWVLAWTAASG